MRNLLKPMIVVLLSMILAGIVLVGMIGCSEQGMMDPPAIENKVLSWTPDQLMTNFMEAYGGRDLDRYAQLLHQDFIYTFNPRQADHLGPTYQYFTREDELITARNMFSGQPVVNSRGQTVAAITDIDFQMFKRSGDWNLAHGCDRDGSLQAVFECWIHVARRNDRDFTIKGSQVFTVAPEPGATDQPNYQIIGWQDLTSLH